MTTLNDDPWLNFTMAHAAEFQLGWTLYSLIAYRGKNSSRTRPYVRAQLNIFIELLNVVMLCWEMGFIPNGNNGIL